MDLSVVIVNYNTADLLIGCLESLAESLRNPPTISWEVVVVDNGSTDGSIEAVRGRYPWVNLISNQENLYYSAANNQGIAATSGRYILILNSDTVILGDVILRLVGRMDDEVDVGASTPMLLDPDGTTQQVCARFSTFGYLMHAYTFLGRLRPGAKARIEKYIRYSGWDRKTEREVEFIPGSCMMLRREALNAVGGFDVRLTHYFSDEDLSQRLRAAGWRVMYYPMRGVVHFEGVSARKHPGGITNIYLQDLLRFTGKHFGTARKWLLAAMLIPNRIHGWLKDVR